MTRFAAVAFLLTLVFFAGTAFAQTRVALVIGNGQYTSLPKLSNPARDADAISRVLRSVGFDVDVGIDLKRAEMDQTLISFARKARRADVALVFFGGHGIQYHGTNYLAPVDAEVEDEADLRRFITAQQIIQDLQSASQVRILVLDACRDNTAVEKIFSSLPASRSAGATRGLSRMNAPEGTLVAFSTQADAVAADGATQNSPFVTALLAHISEPGLDVRLVFARARADVYKETRGAQLPELSDSLVGEFAFTPPTPAISSVGPSMDSNADQIEWNIIKKSSDPSLFANFVEHFPKSPLRAQAEAAQLKLSSQSMTNASERTEGLLGIVTPQEKHPSASSENSGDQGGFSGVAVSGSHLSSSSEGQNDHSESKDQSHQIIASLPLSTTDTRLGSQEESGTVNATLTELKRLGCYAGSTMAPWNSQASEGLQTVSKKYGIAYHGGLPDRSLLDTLRVQSGTPCIPVAISPSKIGHKHINSQALPKVSAPIVDHPQSSKLSPRRPARIDVALTSTRAGLSTRGVNSLRKTLSRSSVNSRSSRCFSFGGDTACE